MSFRESVAEHQKTSVRLNLGQLNVLLDAALDAGAGGRHASQDLTQAARAVGRARDRRLRAVKRAGGKT